MCLVEHGGPEAQRRRRPRSGYAAHPARRDHARFQAGMRTRRRRALDQVTVDIDRGEYVSVSGPSGCGKSTFLSILALLDAPTSGRYWFNGRRVDQLSPAEKARMRNVDVGLIFQSFNLIGDMTVYENVEYPLTLRGVAGRGAQDARGCRARARRPVRARETAAGVALRRPSAACRDRSCASPAARRSSLPTSRRATSIRRAANPSCRCSTNCMPAARPSASRRTTRATSPPQNGRSISSTAG